MISENNREYLNFINHSGIWRLMFSIGFYWRRHLNNVFLLCEIEMGWICLPGYEALSYQHNFLFIFILKELKALVILGYGG
jgi:hypothetical protein